MKVSARGMQSTKQMLEFWELTVFFTETYVTPKQ